MRASDGGKINLINFEHFEEIKKVDVESKRYSEF